MSDTLWILLLLVAAVVVIPTAFFFQGKQNTLSLEEERNTCFEDKKTLAIEADQLKKQMTDMKEQQHETDRERRRSASKIATMEEQLEALEDQKTAWEDERDRLLIRERHLKQQQDQCGSLKAMITEEKIKLLKTESNLEERKKEILQRFSEELTQQLKLLTDEFRRGKFPTTGNSDYMTYTVLAKKFQTKAAFKNNKMINGIAKLNDDLFAITEGSNIIEQFDSTTLSTEERLSLSGYKNLKDVQACNQSKILFVIAEDFTDKKFIKSVDPYKEEVVNHWAVDSCVEKLSVTEDCHVIAACSHKNTINEYASNGQLIREIVLKQEMGILQPRYALKTTDGNFLLSYDGSPLQVGLGLAIVNPNGDVLKSYPDPSQKPELANAMAIDRLGNILVAEMIKGRVLLLSSNLEYKRELVSREHRTGVIISLLLDEVNGRLFVVDCNLKVQDKYCENGRILVFQMQWSNPSVSDAIM